MNRHERRKQAAMQRSKFVDDYVKHLPEITADAALSRPGIAHAVYLHDDWCRVMTHGGGIESCNCNPEVSYYAEPQRS
jgi:hypothetical protein